MSITSHTEERSRTVRTIPCGPAPAGYRRRAITASLMLVVGVWQLGCTSAARTPRIERVFGAAASLGHGRVSTYAHLDQRGAPQAIGIQFDEGSTKGLPSKHSDGHHCFDQNGNGELSETECFGSHERVIPLPDIVAGRDDVPFKWVLLDWNPGGHMPPGVYDVPHFDVHFFIDRIEDVFAIEAGPCGPERVPLRPVRDREEARSGQLHAPRLSQL